MMPPPSSTMMTLPCSASEMTWRHRCRKYSWSLFQRGEKVARTSSRIWFFSPRCLRMSSEILCRFATSSKMALSISTHSSPVLCIINSRNSSATGYPSQPNSREMVRQGRGFGLRCCRAAFSFCRRLYSSSDPMRKSTEGIIRFSGIGSSLRCNSGSRVMFRSISFVLSGYHDDPGFGHRVPIGPVGFQVVADG